MSIKEVFELPQLSVEEHQVRGVLKCIVHTIIFNRALGHVAPRDIDVELISATYPEVGDPRVSERVEDGLKAVEAFVAQHKPRSASGAASKFEESGSLPFTVKLSFYEAIARPGLVKTYQDKVFWEVWKIRLQLISASQSQHDREQRQQALEDDVNTVRTVILMNADSKKDHIPPVLEKDKHNQGNPLTYPFELTTERSLGLAGSILGTVSRMLSRSSHPQPEIMR